MEGRQDLRLEVPSSAGTVGKISRPGLSNVALLAFSPGSVIDEAASGGTWLFMLLDYMLSYT